MTDDSWSCCLQYFVGAGKLSTRPDKKLQLKATVPHSKHLLASTEWPHLVKFALLRKSTMRTGSVWQNARSELALKFRFEIAVHTALNRPVITTNTHFWSTAGIQPEISENSQYYAILVPSPTERTIASSAPLLLNLRRIVCSGVRPFATIYLWWELHADTSIHNSANGNKVGKFCPLGGGFESFQGFIRVIWVSSMLLQ